MQLRGQVDIMLRGKTNFHAISGIKQNKGFGVKFNADFIKKLGNGSAISFGPYVEHFNTKKSKELTVDGITDQFPQIKETQAGVAVKFHF